MPDTAAYYIVTVGGGKCLENTQGAHGVLDCLPKDDDKQKWILETSGDDPNVVYIKNCADGKYLVNTQPYALNGARIAMQDERQEWTIEKGRFPRSCAIRSNACTVGASYLNDFEGVYRDNNYVHMWYMNKALEWWLTWYLVDTKTSATFNPSQTQAIEGTNSKNLEEREKTLAEKEQSLTEKTKSNDDREAAMKEREAKVAVLEGREKTLGEKEKSAADRLKEVEKREVAVQQLEAQGKNTVAEATSKKSQSSGDDLDKKRKEIEQKEAALNERERNIAEQEAALKKAQAAIDGNKAGPSEAPGSIGKDDHDLDLLKAENENLKLKLRIKDLERQLEEARQPRHSSSLKEPTAKPAATSAGKTNTPASTASSKQANGTTHSPSAATTSKPLSKQGQAAKLRDAAKDDGAIVYSCGHVVYPPPRKVDKKVVGILYEGLDQPHAFSARQRAALARSGL